MRINTSRTTPTFFILIWIFTVTDLAKGREYCWQTFNASCDKNEVIVMNSALYGRMRLGKCLKKDYYVGCQADVLPFMDDLCSGKQYCELDIPDNKLQTMVTCRDDLMAYLEAVYKCVKVHTALKSHCNEGESMDVTIPLNTSTGYITSALPQKTRGTMTTCPWRILAQKGQRINVTLFDFSLMSNMGRSDLCKVYVIIHEARVGADVTVCGGERRQKVIYVSEGHEIEIQIVGINVADISNQGRFIVKYEAIGCPSITAPKNGFVKHDGHRAMISCNGTGEIRHLVCNGTTWVGDISTCQAKEGDSSRTAHFLDTSSGFPIGLLVAVVIGVILGIVLGILMLMLVMHCLRKRRQSKAPKGKIFLTPSSAPPVAAPTFISDKELVRTGEYGYAHVWELQQLQNHPDVIHSETEKIPVFEHTSCGECMSTFGRSVPNLVEEKYSGCVPHSSHIFIADSTNKANAAQSVQCNNTKNENTELNHATFCSEYYPQVENS